MSVKDKIIDGYFYTCKPGMGGNTLTLHTGSGGARNLYDEFIKAGIPDEVIGDLLGIALKDHPFIPLNQLKVVDKDKANV